MSRKSWFNLGAGLIGAFLVAAGVWDYAVSGAYKLIVIGMITLGLLVVAERQRRAFSLKHEEEQE